MGTDERTEVTEECPSAGEQVADSNMRQIIEARQEKKDLRIPLHAEQQMMTNEGPTFQSEEWEQNRLDELLTIA